MTPYPLGNSYVKGFLYKYKIYSDFFAFQFWGSVFSLSPRIVVNCFSTCCQCGLSGYNLSCFINNCLHKYLKADPCFYCEVECTSFVIHILYYHLAYHTCEVTTICPMVISDQRHKLNMNISWIFCKLYIHIQTYKQIGI